MSVRAKFRLNSYTTEMHHYCYPHKNEKGEVDYSRPEEREKRTLNFTPVTGSGKEATEEDRMFWEASPSGSLQLGVVNQEAWKHFELGKTYYLDFSPAD